MGDNSQFQGSRPQLSRPQFNQSLQDDVGYKIGQLIRQKWALAGLVLLLLIVCWCVYGALVDCERQNASVGSIVKHYGCKRKGGCSTSCPYADPNDPRYALVGHLETVKMISTLANDAFINVHTYVKDLLSKLDTATNTQLTNAVSSPSQTMDICMKNIFPLITKIEDLVSTYSNQEAPTSEIYDAQNRAAALEAAAVINLRVFSVCSMKIAAILKNHRLANLTDGEKSKVDKFDDEYTKVLLAKTSIDNLYEKVMANISTDDKVVNNYGTATQSIMTKETSRDVVVSIMAHLITLSSNSTADEQLARIQFAIIEDVYARAIEKFEGFNNSLPGLVPSEEMSSLIVNGDYNTALIKTALEPEIVSNHQKFANDRMAFDSGGGVPSVRDDDNDINPWVGLFGRPTYKKTDGTSADISNEPLRSIPSNDPNTLMRENTPRLTF